MFLCNDIYLDVIILLSVSRVTEPQVSLLNTNYAATCQGNVIIFEYDILTMQQLSLTKWYTLCHLWSIVEHLHCTLLVFKVHYELLQFLRLKI